MTRNTRKPHSNPTRRTAKAKKEQRQEIVESGCGKSPAKGPIATIDRAAIAAQIGERLDILEQARQALLTEFVGIDEKIDAIVDAIRPWFLFPEAQERPLVINLWGSPSKSAPSRELSGYGASLRT